MVKIGDDMDTDTSAPLACAGLTAFGAIKNAARVSLVTVLLLQ